ncbi:hypothetical protein [Pinibacter soli]|uniref:Uncharacterized protein n=1 Tax=Pinibacter soli TaxID=3044211 RepID=A0ABT6RG49_9BACT|nr:hypothetical protein [Pinibacter soli]MDI3321396.1 hypothetical protein [Pinibacter soli]
MHFIIRKFFILGIWILVLNTGYSQVWGTNNSRSETRDDASVVTQNGSSVPSGFFETYNPINYPAGASGLWHLLGIRYSNSSNNPVNLIGMQFAGSAFGKICISGSHHIILHSRGQEF